MIKFVIRAKKNPLKRDQVKFYPQMAPGVPVMLRTIVGRIEKRSGVSSASVKAVLDALQYEILQTLSDGNSCLLYPSDAADDLTRLDLSGSRILANESL